MPILVILGYLRWPYDWVPIALRANRGTVPPVAVKDWKAAEFDNATGTRPLLWKAGRGVRLNGANKLKPLMPNPPFFSQILLFYPFSYGAIFC